MKKRLVMLLAGLLTVLSMGFGLAQFSDVPAGHWAKEAVEALAAKGLVIGFPDGTFRGNESLTRYQAALIIYRLLQQIEGELKAKGESPTMQAMSSEDLEALKNAVQELAAELAALGVRVSALEDSAATKEDIARLEAMIQELKAQPAPEPGMDAAALQDLADRVEAASIAADTALAQAQQLAEQLDALAQDVEGVKGDLASLQTQVEANAQAIQALNELAVLLNQDVLSLQDRVTALEKGLADLQGIDFEQFASKEDVAAVQEFAAALRSDLVGLSEKVSKLEGTVGDLSGKVSKLERNAFTISGSLSLGFGAFAGSGGANNNFDIDRVFSSNFSTGDGNGNGLVVDEADLGKNAEGETTATLSLTLKTNALDAKSSPGGYNAYPGLVQFSITGSWTNPSGGSNATAGPNLVVDTVATTLAVAKDQSLSFSFGRSVKTKFSEYVFDNDGVSYGHGLVATYKPGVLGATVTGVYASKLGANGDNLYARGAGLALSPMQGFSLRGAVVQQGTDILGGGGMPVTVYGVGADLALGSVALSGEYFSSDAAANANGYYVKAKAGVGPITVEGNYRSIGAGVTFANMLSYDADPANSANAAPFHADQQGYGAKATVSLGAITLGGFYDTYTGTGARTAYGAEAGLKFGAFSLSGYYRVVDAGNDGTPNDSAAKETAASNSYVSSGSDYTQYGAKLSHDGKAEGALIKGLNLTASYDVRPQFAPGARTDIAVYGDFSLSLGILKATLLGRYHSQDVAGAPASSYTTIKYGVKAETEALAIPLKPSLFGEYVARSTDGGTADNAEAKYAVGLKLNEFLFPNSSFEAKYGSYTASNVNAILVGNAEKAWDPSVDHLYDDRVNASGVNGSVTGFYLSWSYWDLVMSYADFVVDNNGNPEYGRGFKISYKVNF
ncbi:S-layer homology domain-containing protein [Thermus sp. NMX2.A1]|uniref:S-layer homology domain-containing protein n=1 Tax=Thermus sp. NMX2.A1 TaxID=570924 RepID=UPI0003DBDB0E|nr:S-layer homology domain-containing protein [Thermus sp. NMX2.A1]ETN88853.1 S-layer protein [Thermus sp. NMX2.A1]